MQLRLPWLQLGSWLLWGGQVAVEVSQPCLALVGQEAEAACQQEVVEEAVGRQRQACQQAYLVQEVAMVEPPWAVLEVLVVVVQVEEVLVAVGPPVL